MDWKMLALTCSDSTFQKPRATEAALRDTGLQGHLSRPDNFYHWGFEFCALVSG